MMKKNLLIYFLMFSSFGVLFAQEGSEGSAGHSEGSSHQVVPPKIFQLETVPELAGKSLLFHPTAARNLENLVVLHAGRYKPLLALSKEFSWALSPSKKTHFLRRQGNELSVSKEDTLAVFLDMVFRPEVWQNVPLLPVGNEQLREICGLNGSHRQTHPYLSLSEFISLMQSHQPFHKLVQRNIEEMSLPGDDANPKTTLDDKTRMLLSAAEWVQVTLVGDILMVVPHSSDPALPWASIGEIAGAELSEDRFNQLKTIWNGLAQSWSEGDLPTFEKFSQDLKEFQLSLINPSPEMTDQLERVNLEAYYWRSSPFMQGSFLSFLSLILLLPALGSRGKWRKTLRVLGFLSLLAATGYIAWGFWMRATIADRGPIHSIYETIVYATMGTMIFAMLLEIFSRRGLALIVGAALGCLGGICSSKLGTRMDPNFQHVMPVLRSGWLVVHVQVIILGYAAALLAAGLGHAILISRLWLKRTDESVKVLENLCYRSVQFTALFLTSGILLGAWWANESWGRYWGWDPKETWALISLLIFLALIHFRFSGVVRQLGMASMSIVGGMMIIFCWWGVNYVLGQGLHAYATGFSEKMAKPAMIYYGIELVFLAWALSKYLEDKQGKLSKK